MKKGKIYKIVINILLILTFLMFIIPNINYVVATADPITNPGDFDPFKTQTQDPGITTVTEKAGKIFAIIQTIGIVVAVITLSILGIKYMLGSVEEKAEYKKTMIPYIIGIVFVVAILGILTTFNSIIKGLF